MKWMITEDKLGSDQVEVIDEIGKINNKPIWIKGHAGSGNSVLLLHSLADYLVKKPTANVCVVVFTRALVDLLETGLKQIPKLNGKTIPVHTIYDVKDLIDNKNRFDAIFCDEVQDLPISFIQSMKSACDHLIIAGDSEQSIYEAEPKWKESTASPTEITNNIQPIEKKLGYIYRLTDSILKILQNVFPSMSKDLTRIGDADTDIKLISSNAVDNFKEVEYVWKLIKETNIFHPDKVSAVLLWKHDKIIEFTNLVLKMEKVDPWVRVNDSFGKNPNYTLLNSYLKSKGVPLMYVGNNYGSLTAADIQNKVVLMTYHSSKGLDFDYVYLPMVNTEMKIHSKEDSLLLVALSRSKSGLLVSYTGSLYNGLVKFLGSIKPKAIENEESSEIIF